MNLKLFRSNKPVEIIATRFPAGETCIRINDIAYANRECSIHIFMNFKSNSDLFDLCLLVDAVKRFYKISYMTLAMPYLPYARQDRVCNTGESLSIKVVADLINSLNFKSVNIWDIHSQVGVALINNLVHNDLSYCFQDVNQFMPLGATTLVSPDAGAEKKVFDVAKNHGYDFVRATKIRNILTGKIEKTTLIDGFNSSCKEILIVDDICDGGRTFIELAKAIREHDTYSGQDISLYVTHGIFSAGLEVFDGIIDQIYVANLMNSEYDEHPLITTLYN